MLATTKYSSLRDVPQPPSTPITSPTVSIQPYAELPDLPQPPRAAALVERNVQIQKRDRTPFDRRLQALSAEKAFDEKERP
jgi:hypothetical protein